MIPEDRALRALSDVVAVEHVAPGMCKVVTWSDAYTVDARGEGCTCEDKQYNLNPGEKCKHHAAALLATTDLPAPFDVVDNLDERPEPRPDDCLCVASDALQCWPCAVAGYDSPNPDANKPGVGGVVVQ